MSGKSGGTNSISCGTNSNAGEGSVRHAEYAVHREAVNDRLDAIEASAAENGVQLKQNEDSTTENGGRLKRSRAC